MTFYHISSPSLYPRRVQKRNRNTLYIYINKLTRVILLLLLLLLFCFFPLIVSSIIIQHTSAEIIIIHSFKIRSRWAACVRHERTMTVTKPEREEKNQNVIVIKETNIINNNKRNTNTVDFNNRIRRVKCFGKISTYSSARLLQASGVKNRPTEKLNHCHH